MFTLENIENKFGLEMSPENSETMAFLGQDPVRCAVIVGSKCLQQLINFKYLGCEIFYENIKDSQQKLSQIRSNAGNFKLSFVKNRSRLRVYSAMDVPSFPCGSEIWTFRKKRIKN